MSVVVRIDPTLCRGHAICALHLADEVALDRWGFGSVIAPVVVSRRATRRALRAAAACPNGAITIIDGEDVSGTDPQNARVGG